MSSKKKGTRSVPTRSSKRKTGISSAVDEAVEDDFALAVGTSTPAAKRRRTRLSSTTGSTLAFPEEPTPNNRYNAMSTSVSHSASSISSLVHDEHDCETPATSISSRSPSNGDTKLLEEATAKVLAGSSAPAARRRSTRMALVKKPMPDDVEDDEDSDEEEFVPSESDDDGDDDDFIEEDGKTKSTSRAARRTTASSSMRAAAVIITSDRRQNINISNDTIDGFINADEDGSDFSELTALSDIGGFDDNNDEQNEQNSDLLLQMVVRASRLPRPGKGSSSKLTRAQRERNQLYNWHPQLASIWDDLDKREKIPVKKDPQPAGLALTLLPFQLEGLHWLRKQEQTEFHGGILADEMGMGKTIQTIALLMSEPRQKPNLVVAPTVALMQWKSEIDKYTGAALKVGIFHGQNRDTDHKSLAENDVVMTTYSVLESSFRKQQHGHKRKDGIVKAPSALHQITFHRVVLDEAHQIKDRSCNTARAVFALKTKYKLCLSGTPLQNRIGEFFSLLRFLEADPFSYYFCRRCPCKSLHWKFSDNRHCDLCSHRPMDHSCWFNMELLKPIQSYGNQGQGREAFEKLQKLLGHIMLRRTKVERADDLGLPPRIVRVRRDYFNEEELDLYDSIYGESKRKFNTYVAQGVVLNNYANIFTLITRMRQLADHPDLVLRKDRTEASRSTLVCCICDDEAEDAIQSKCHHKFCRVCVTKYIDSYTGRDSPDCPHCHIPLSIDLSQPAIEEASEVKKGSIVSRIDMSNWRSSTKIEALVEELYKLRGKTNTIKSIVFSQFTSMLHLVEWRLHRGGFKTTMLEGSMSPAQREAVIKHFMENTEVEVFLVSLKAGGVALNLTEASQVFILDPWWNPSVEWQSGDRVHRIGQKRPCRITRLVIEDSIESRIIELQEKKARMIQATVGGDQKSMEKLTPADMQFLFAN